MTALPVDAVLVALVAAIVQFAKPYLELWLAPTNPLHDNTIRLFAVLLAVGFRLLEFGVPLTGPDSITLIGYGIGTGVSAIGIYHILSGVPVTPPAPPPLIPPAAIAVNANPAAQAARVVVAPPEPPAPHP